MRGLRRRRTEGVVYVRGTESAHVRVCVGLIRHAYMRGTETARACTRQTVNIDVTKPPATSAPSMKTNTRRVVLQTWCACVFCTYLSSRPVCVLLIG